MRCLSWDEIGLLFSGEGSTIGLAYNMNGSSCMSSAMTGSYPNSRAPLTRRATIGCLLLLTTLGVCGSTRLFTLMLSRSELESRLLARVNSASYCGLGNLSVMLPKFLGQRIVLSKFSRSFFWICYRINSSLSERLLLTPGIFSRVSQVGLFTGLI